MEISNAGLDLIKSFEGYLTAQPDGSCVAYLCPANVPTIGWGCTEGVKLGMRWTKAEATEGLRRELDKIEAGVNRLITIKVSQSQYDALVSFAYNVGLGALGRSTLLRKLNAGDLEGAEREFPRWNKGGGRVLRGLERRRLAEVALFQSDVQSTETQEEPAMAQAVDVPTPIRDALKSSKTIWGTLLAFFGAVIQWFSEVVASIAGFAIEAVRAAAGLEPIQQLASGLGANMPAIGFGLTATGIIVALSRRINAASQGKIG